MPPGCANSWFAMKRAVIACAGPMDSSGDSPSSESPTESAGWPTSWCWRMKPTREAAWAEDAVEILETLERHAVEDHGGLNWAPVLGDTALDRCQWSHGAPGIRLVFSKAAQVLDAPVYREIALKVGEATYQCGDFRRKYHPMHRAGGQRRAVRRAVPRQRRGDVDVARPRVRRSGDGFIGRTCRKGMRGGFHVRGCGAGAFLPAAAAAARGGNAVHVIALRLNSPKHPGHRRPLT